MSEIIVNESFLDDDSNLFEDFDNLKNEEFSSQDLLDLKVEAEELSKESEINELKCYDLVKENIEYKLPHQTNGAIQILRDLNASALLADEVGLGKTITTGFVLKEGIVRGFIKRALIITPPSLVDQWVAELKEKLGTNNYTIFYLSE